MKDVHFLYDHKEALLSDLKLVLCINKFMVTNYIL